MSSSSIRSLEIAKESSYCSLGSNGVPSTSGLSFQAVEFIDASQVTPVSDTVLDQPNGARGGLYANPPEILQTTSGTIIKRGTMTIDFYLRSSGSSAITDGIRALLGTRFVSSSPTENKSTVSSASSNSIVVGMASFAAVGDIIGVQKSPDAPTYYAHVLTTSSATNQTTITVDPPLTGLVNASDKISVLNDFRLPSFGGDPLKNGGSSPYNTSQPPTVALRIIGDGWSQVCYGCQMTGLTISGTDGDSRAVKCSATINVACAIDSGSGTPVVGQKYGGPIEHSLAAPITISSGFTTTAPTSSITSSTPPCVDQWTLTLTWTCESSACGNIWVGKAPLEAVSMEASLDVMLGGTSKQASLVTELKAGEYVGVSLGFSGDMDGQTSGGAVVIPAAFVSDGSVSTVDLGAGFVRTHCVFGIGPNVLDASGNKPCIQIALM